MKDRGEKRLYVVVAASIDTDNGCIIQPSGRQIAQACHAVGKYRKCFEEAPYVPITTIVLQARDSAELVHVDDLLNNKHIKIAIFLDENEEYGNSIYPTAFCTEPVYKDQIKGILDYLPLWGSK